MPLSNPSGIPVSKLGVPGGVARLSANGVVEPAISGTDNAGVGVGAQQTITSSAKLNTALGTNAQRNIGSSQRNTAVGAEAQAALEDNPGGANTAVGHEAQQRLTTGTHNEAIGDGCMGGQTITGGFNTAMGVEAQYSITTASSNVSIGYNSLHEGTTCTANTCLGVKSGYNITTGASNVFLGFETGVVLTGASSGNIFIGYEAGPTVGGDINNTLYIHNKSSSPTTALIYGNFETKELAFNTARMGFFGATPVVQPAKPTTLTEVIEALKKLGLVAP